MPLSPRYLARAIASRTDTSPKTPSSGSFVCLPQTAGPLLLLNLFPRLASKTPHSTLWTARRLFSLRTGPEAVRYGSARVTPPIRFNLLSCRRPTLARHVGPPTGVRSFLTQPLLGISGYSRLASMAAPLAR